MRAELFEGHASEDSAIANAARALGVATRVVIDTARVPCRAARRLLSWRALRRGKTSSGAAEGLEFSAAKLAADEGLTALARALSDPDPANRALALEVICEFSADRAAGLISRVLQDPDASVRCAAAAAAARVRASGVVFALILALDDTSPEVRAAAARAIEAITGKGVALDPSDEPSKMRGQMEELKGWWKQKRFEELARAHELEVASR